MTALPDDRESAQKPGEQPPKPAGALNQGLIAGVSNRVLAGLAIGVVVLLFIVSNTKSTKVRFIFLSAKTPLWEALTFVAVAGFVAGFLVSRHRYTRRRDKDDKDKDDKHQKD